VVGIFAVKLSMNILVTGPDGFVGTSVCRELVRSGHVVRGAQWQSAPLPDGCESVVVGDIGGKTDWRAALTGVDIVIHLAARVHVMNEVASDPLEAFRCVNVGGTRALAEAAARAGVKRFVFMSSIKVHGENTEVGEKDEGRRVKGEEDGCVVLPRAFSEADVPRPADPYGVSKWEAEQVLREIESASEMKVTVLRPPLVYGPGVKANFQKLMGAVKKGLPLPFGCVENRRSFLGLTNLTSAVIACVEHPMAGGETFVISDGEDVSSPELVRRMAVALGRRPFLLPVPLCMMRFAGRMLGKSDQVNRLFGSLVLDSSKIRQVLGWVPPSDMSSELKRLADTMR